MSIDDIRKALSRTFQGMLKNLVSLADDSTLEKDLKPLKIGDKNTPIELSETELKFSGTINAEAVNVNGSAVQTGTDAGATELNELSDVTYSAGDLTITSLDSIIASSNLTLNPDGELNFTPATEVKSDAPLKIKEAANAVADTTAYGQLWVKTATPNELWFTDDAGNDIPITLQPFVKTAQFQDDIGTLQHYIPFNNMFEQGVVGAENLGFIAPFNMKLQKVAIKCSEDISGATLEVGFWAIANGTTTHHNAATNQQNVDVTGGAAHTTAIADFTGTVNDGTSSGGGSNAISAGEWVDLSIQADTDVTSSSAEFWITCYFLADLTTTV